MLFYDADTHYITWQKTEENTEMGSYNSHNISWWWAFVEGIGERRRAVLKPLSFFFSRKTHSTVLSQVPRPKFFRETSSVEPSPKITTVTLTFAQRSPEVFGVYTLLYLQYRTRQLSHFTSLLYFRVQLQVSKTSLGAWRGRPTLVFIIISNVTVCLSL